MFRPKTSNVSALSGFVANGLQAMPVVSSAPSTHSVRRVFPSTAGSQSFQSGPSARGSLRLTVPSRSPRHRPLSRCYYPLARPSPYSRDDSTRQLTHRPFAPVRLFCPHPPRYYGLIRRSPGLRAASCPIPARSLRRRCPSHLPFFALPDLFRLPPSLPRQVSAPCSIIPGSALLLSSWRVYPLRTLDAFRLNWVHAGVRSRGCNVRFMLRPPDSLGPLAQPRLRVSLPPPYPSWPFYDRACLGKVSLHQVGYHFSGQSSPCLRQDLHLLVCQRSKAAQTPSYPISI